MATIKRQIIYNMGHFVWLCWINREGILWCYLHIVAPHGLYPGERRILMDQKLSAVSGRNIYIGCMIIEYDRYTYIFGKEFWNPLEPPQFYHGWDPINFYGWFMTLLNSWPRQTGKIALPLLARPWFQNCSVARNIPNHLWPKNGLQASNELRGIFQAMFDDRRPWLHVGEIRRIHQAPPGFEMKLVVIAQVLLQRLCPGAAFLDFWLY